jgi:hypothetical protein
VTKEIASDIVVKLIYREGTHVLSFERAFDSRSYDLPLLRWQEKADRFKRRLPGLLEPLRNLIGQTKELLTEDQAKQAADRIQRFSYGMLRELLEGTGVSAAKGMSGLADFLKPVFLSDSIRSTMEKSIDKSRRPIIEIESSTADELAWRLPLEFLPLAPEPTPLLTARDRLEAFVGFRAEVVRLLRGGPSQINLNANGRLPVYLFAYAGEDFDGIERQLAFFEENAHVLFHWPTKAPREDTRPPRRPLFAWPRQTSSDDGRPLRRTTIANTSEGVTALAEGLLSLPLPLGNSIQCVAHFACHYSASAEPALNFGQCADGSDLTIPIFDLGGEIEDQMGKRQEPVQLATLMFLNACETGAGGLHDETLLRLFRERSPTAIIGSEALLPDTLAGSFADHFYRALLRGASVSAAMLAARRALLELFANPVGLFYTLYGNPVLRIPVPPTDRESPN